MQKRIMTGLWILALAVCVADTRPALKAQSTRGSIVGTVYDQQQTPIPNAAIIATNNETLLDFPAQTDPSGSYRLLELPPGSYKVLATATSDFQPALHLNVRVDLDRETVENFVLRVPPRKEAYTVTSVAPLIVTNGATVSTNFSERQITLLPILTRDPNNLALLAPGVLAVRTFSFASTLVPFAANGSRGRDNNFIIDSVNNNEPLFGGAATQFTNTDIFADYTIITAEPKAEFGRNSGATVNVITKSGSEQLHGSLFWFGQDDTLDAETRVEENALLKGPAPFFENVAGATLGGPLKLKKDTFFFISYQWDGARTNLSNVFPLIASIPTTKGLQQLRQKPSTPALQVLLASPSVRNLPGASSDCFGQTSTAGLPAMNPCTATGVPNPQGQTIPNPDGVQYGTYLVPNANLFAVHDHQASGRIDTRLNDSNDLYGRYLFDDLLAPKEVLAPAGEVAFSDLGQLPDSQNIQRERTQSFLLDERLSGATWLNEARFSFNRIAQGVGQFQLPASARSSQPAATVGDNFGGFNISSNGTSYQGNFPSAGNQFTLGNDTGPTQINSNLFEVQDNFSVSRGRNNIKAGGDFVRTESNILDVPYDLGHYFFGEAGASGGFSEFASEPSAVAGATTNALAVFQSFPDLIVNGNGQIAGQGQNELPLRDLYGAGFFQDDIRARPDFTISLGIRYENFGQPISSIAQLNHQVPTVKTAETDFSPRFGFAWSPRSRTVLRGGYALLYDPMPLNIPLLIWQSAPVSPLIATLTPKGFTNPPAAENRPPLQATGVFPNSPITLADLESASGVLGCGTSISSGQRSGAYTNLYSPGSVPLIDCSSQDTVDQNLTSPYVQTYSIGIQQELSKNIVFEVGWLGSKGTGLYQRLDMNPFHGWSTSCLQQAGPNFDCINPRLNPDRGDITEVTNHGFSTYNALQVSLNTRTLENRAGRFGMTAAYTWSHTIDNASEIFGPGIQFIQGDYAGTLESGNPDIQGSVEAITPFPQSSTDLRDEKGNSSFDRRHRLAMSYIWSLPSPRGALSSLLGGWELSGIGTLQSGQPYTALNGIPLGACADANGDGLLTNDRPDIRNPRAPLNSVALLADPSCINTSAGYVGLNGQPIDPATAHFVQMPLGGGNGNAGRNTLVGPGLADLDVAVHKDFKWGESRVIQFRWEVYDVFNRSNPGFALGNVFATDAQPTPGFAFSPRASAAGVTGNIPENAIDAYSAFTSAGKPVYDFLTQRYMNTGNRRMQVGIHIIF